MGAATHYVANPSPREEGGGIPVSGTLRQGVEFWGGREKVENHWHHVFFWYLCGVPGWMTIVYPVVTEHIGMDSKPCIINFLR